MLMNTLWRSGFGLYFVFLSWQLLTPVTIVAAGSWDKVFHFGAFALLSGLAFLAWQRVSASIIIMGLLSYAALTEILQHFIVGRSFSIMDWVADSLGIFVAMLITTNLLKRVKFLDTTYH